MALAHEDPQQVPLVEAHNLRRNFDRTKPLRICGLTDAWPARALDREQFLSMFGDLRFRLRPCATLHEYGYPGPTTVYTTLREYFAEGHALSTGGVVFENDFHGAHRALGYCYKVPDILGELHGKPIFSAAKEHTGVGFHCHSESWLAQLHGRKAWFLLPKDADPPPMLPPWWYLRERPRGLLVSVLEPGEVMVVPDCWWHATWNLDEFTLAVGWEGGACSSWTAEMHAIADGDCGRLEDALVSSGREVNEQMLELAGRSGHADVLRLLINRAGAASLLRRFATEVAVAAARGDHICVLDLLREIGLCAASMQVLHGRGSRGSTALHEASCCGQLLATRWLLIHGADIRAKDGACCEPLHLAALHGQARVAQALLDAAAHVDANHTRGGTKALSQAAFNGHPSVSATLLAARARVDAQDSLGMTALHYAALRGHSMVAEALLLARADVTMCDHERRTALHFAARGYEDRDKLPVPDVGFSSAPDANFAVTSTLLAARADPRARDGQGFFPLDYARGNKHVGVVQLLGLRAGESTSVDDFQAETIRRNAS